MVALAELFTAGADLAPGMTLVNMPLSAIVPDPENERFGDIADPNNEEFAGLVESVREHGVREPVQVFPVEAGRYMLRSGHRRRAAATAAGLEAIPAIVVEPPGSKLDRTFERLGANRHRSDLTDAELAATLKEALDEHPELTQAELALRAEISPSRVSNLLRAFDLDEEILALWRDGSLKTGHILPLLGIQRDELRVYGDYTVQRTAAEVRLSLAQTWALQHYSARDMETRVRSYNQDQDRAYASKAESDRWRAERQAEAAAQIARDASTDEAWAEIKRQASEGDPEANAFIAAKKARAQFKQQQNEYERECQRVRNENENRRQARRKLVQEVIKKRLSPPAQVASYEEFRGLDLARFAVITLAELCDYKRNDERRGIINRIEDSTLRELLELMVEMSVSRLDVDYNGRGVDTGKKASKWANGRFKLSEQIDMAIAGAGLADLPMPSPLATPPEPVAPVQVAEFRDAQCSYCGHHYMLRRLSSEGYTSFSCPGCNGNHNLSGRCEFREYDAPEKRWATFLDTLTGIDRTYAETIVAEYNARGDLWSWHNWIYADMDVEQGAAIVNRAGEILDLPLVWDQQRSSADYLRVRPTERTIQAAAAWIRTQDRDIRYAWTILNGHIAGTSYSSHGDSGNPQDPYYYVPKLLRDPYKDGHTDYPGPWQTWEPFDIAAEMRARRGAQQAATAAAPPVEPFGTDPCAQCGQPSSIIWANRLGESRLCADCADRTRRLAGPTHSGTFTEAKASLNALADDPEMAALRGWMEEHASEHSSPDGLASAAIWALHGEDTEVDDEVFGELMGCADVILSGAIASEVTA